MELEKDKIKKSLKVSFLDGAFASAMIGFTQDYFTPFLLLIGAGVRHVGALSALPNLFSSLAQIISPDIVEKLKSRRIIINTFVFIQAIMILPMIFIALKKNVNPWVFIGIAVLFATSGALAGPAWSSLMSDLVEHDKRGKYFGWRNKTLGFITVIMTLFAGLTLNSMKNINIFLGFAIIFSIAFIFRIISFYFLTRMHEPVLEYKKEDSFTLFDFLARIRESNFTKFVLFVAMLNFSVNLASPFFAVLMLRDMHFSYIVYTMITATATLTVYATIERWGMIADRVGNLRVLKFTAPIIGLLPLLWVINRNPIFLFFAQLVSGFAWAGFNLCASNFIYDAVSPAKRTRCVAYFNIFNGLALCIGALIGGFLINKLPILFGYKILSLFLVSSFLRILSGLILPVFLKEVRKVEIEKISNYELFFSIISKRPILGEIGKQ